MVIFTNEICHEPYDLVHIIYSYVIINELPRHLEPVDDEKCEKMQFKVVINGDEVELCIFFVFDVVYKSFPSFKMRLIQAKYHN